MLAHVEVARVEPSRLADEAPPRRPTVPGRERKPALGSGGWRRSGGSRHSTTAIIMTKMLLSMVPRAEVDGFRCIVFRDGDEIELGPRERPSAHPVLPRSLVVLFRFSTCPTINSNNDSERLESFSYCHASKNTAL